MKKNFLKVAVLGIVVSSLLTISTYAKNNSDSFTQLSLGNLFFAKSSSRLKEDTSKAYFKPTYFSDNTSSDDWAEAFLTSGGGREFPSDKTEKITTGNINNGNEYYISNWAYEYNKNTPIYVAMGANSKYRVTYTYYLGGLWSPDSSR